MPSRSTNTSFDSWEYLATVFREGKILDQCWQTATELDIIYLKTHLQYHENSVQLSIMGYANCHDNCMHLSKTFKKSLHIWKFPKKFKSHFSTPSSVLKQGGASSNVRIFKMGSVSIPNTQQLP
jgi:hypothetical protein